MSDEEPLDESQQSPIPPHLIEIANAGALQTEQHVTDMVSMHKAFAANRLIGQKHAYNEWLRNYIDRERAKYLG